MTTASPRRSQLLSENRKLRVSLEEAEELIRAIRRGTVDAFVVDSPGGPQVYVLQGLDAEANRFRGEILAQVSDAVIALDWDERIIYLNVAAERLYGIAASEALGRKVSVLYRVRWHSPEDEAAATT